MTLSMAITITLIIPYKFDTLLQSFPRWNLGCMLFFVFVISYQYGLLIIFLWRQHLTSSPTVIICILIPCCPLWPLLTDYMDSKLRASSVEHLVLTFLAVSSIFVFHRYDAYHVYMMNILNLIVFTYLWYVVSIWFPIFMDLFKVNDDDMFSLYKFFLILITLLWLKSSSPVLTPYWLIFIYL